VRRLAHLVLIRVSEPFRDKSLTMSGIISLSACMRPPSSIGGDESRGLLVDDDIPAEQHAADDLPGMRERGLGHTRTAGETLVISTPRGPRRFGFAVLFQAP
jgi:hypothetical protein